jgi:hypothetical protein
LDAVESWKLSSKSVVAKDVPSMQVRSKTKADFL